LEFPVSINLSELQAHESIKEREITIMLRKSAVISANRLFILIKFVIIREVKEAGAVGKWAGV